jgi:hypothetical protein
LPFRDASFDLALFPHNIVECSPKEFGLLVEETVCVLVANGIFMVSVTAKWAREDGQEPTLRDARITIPQEGTFAYPAYSWSSEAVVRAVSARFRTVKLTDMPERGGHGWSSEERRAR